MPNWGALAGAGIGAIGGSKGSSSGGTPTFVKKQLKRGYRGLREATERPVEEAIAPINADQTAAMDMVRGNIGLGAGTIQEAIDKFRSASNGVTPANIDQFYNPYQDRVIDAATSGIENARARAMLGINAQAEKAGAFGGDREAVLKAMTAEDFNRNLASTIGGLQFSGYESALDAAFRNNATQLGGAQSMLLGADAQRQAAFGDAAALQGVGDTLYAYDQSLLDYPIRMAQLMVDAGGVGMGASRPTSSGGGVSGAMSGAAGGYDLFGTLMGG